MHDALTVVWFAAAITGCVAVIVGLFAPRPLRSRLLFAASICFTVAGVLGILSIGVVFLVLAVICFSGARRSAGSSQHTAAVGER